MIQSYTGPYVVEPTEAGKMLSTARRTLRQNVVVSPVPPKFVGSGIRRKGATTITPTEREQIEGAKKMIQNVLDALNGRRTDGLVMEEDD